MIRNSVATLVPGCCFVDARRVVTRSHTQGGRPAALANINQVLARQQQQIRLCSCVISARREKHEICKGNHEEINNHCVTSSVIEKSTFFDCDSFSSIVNPRLAASLALVVLWRKASRRRCPQCLLCLTPLNNRDKGFPNGYACL